MAYKTIPIKCFVPVRDEAIANAAITPGHLIELMSTGKVKVHATAGGPVKGAFFAVEDELQGNEIGTAYSSGDLVQYNHFRAGDRVYALLANGNNVAIGDLLESAGDGTLQKWIADNSAAPNQNNQIVGIARSALDTSGSSGADPSGAWRIIVEIV